MTTKTRTAQTAHGDVPYSTVECSSCGQEVREEDACRFIIGDVKERHDSSHYARFKMPDEGRFVGWVCEFCREDPARYPSPARRRSAGRVRAVLVGIDTDDVIGWVFVALAVVPFLVFLACVAYWVWLLLGMIA